MEADQILIEIVKYLFIAGISFIILYSIYDAWEDEFLDFGPKVILSLILLALLLSIWALFLDPKPLLWK